jgi:shikimate dehydrogenase
VPRCRGGGVGSAIAASIAAEGAGSIALFDTRSRSAESLAARLRQHYPAVAVEIRDNDPAGYDLVVNATPLGMKPGDPLPFDPTRLDRKTFVGEVVMKRKMTPLLEARESRSN